MSLPKIPKNPFWDFGPSGVMAQRSGDKLECIITRFNYLNSTP
jgi:hypothetical protein